MAIKSLFIDMDHTICDTEKADRLGIIDFQELLHKYYPQNNNLKKISELYCKCIYGARKSSENWKKKQNESEITFRGRLFKQCAAEFNLNIEIEKEEYFAQKFMDLRIQHFNFFEQVPEYLLSLKKKYQLILITNGALFSQEPKIEQTQMQNYMHHLILGGHLDKQKPHSSIFELALQKAQCNKNQVIHIGDSLGSDIQGAINAGIKSIWINPNKKALAFNEPKPNFEVENFLQIQSILEELNQKIF